MNGVEFEQINWGFVTPTQLEYEECVYFELKTCLDHGVIYIYI